MGQAVLAALLWIAAASFASSADFVRTDGTRFVVSGETHAFAGVNYWQGMNLASRGPGGDRERLNRELDTLTALGITNLRVLAGSEGPNDEPWRVVPALMTEPGVYDSLVLDGLDYLVAAAGARGLRAVMCLTNFWQWSGGMAQYVSWNGGGPIPYPEPEPGGDWWAFQQYAAGFYANPGAMEDFRDHIAFLLSRVNPYTGVAYKDDPAIMAWELANEPRGPRGRPEALDRWIDETAAYIKSLDPRHLVTTGSEGDTPAPEQNGLDFMSHHDGPDIDYATIHVWPQNWGWFDPVEGTSAGAYASAEAKARSYFAEHAAAAAALGKPMVLEEFGLARDGGSYDPASATTYRDSFFTAMYDEVYASAFAGGPGMGDNLWAWSGEGRPVEPCGRYPSPGDPWTGDPPHERQGWYSVYDGDRSTTRRIADHAAAMKGLARTVPSE